MEQKLRRHPVYFVSFAAIIKIDRRCNTVKSWYNKSRYAESYIILH